MGSSFQNVRWKSIQRHEISLLGHKQHWQRNGLWRVEGGGVSRSYHSGVQKPLGSLAVVSAEMQEEGFQAHQGPTGPE